MAYGRVHEQFWDDPVIRALPEDARTLMLYLLTCRHKNRLGCFVLDLGYAAADLQWDRDRANAAMAELEDAGRATYDREHRVVFLPRWLKWNTMENHKVVTGALSELAGIPDGPHIEALLRSVDKYSRPHYGPVAEQLRNRIANRSPNDSDTVPHIVGGAIRSRSRSRNHPETESSSLRSEDSPETRTEPATDAPGARPDPIAAATTEFCERTGATWRLPDRPVEVWARQLPAKFPALSTADILHELEAAADWWVGQGKTPKAPEQAIRNWLHRAKPSQNGDDDEGDDYDAFIRQVEAELM